MLFMAQLKGKSLGTPAASFICKPFCVLTRFVCQVCANSVIYPPFGLFLESAGSSFVQYVVKY